MSKLDKDQVIAAFTEAYTAKNGKAPTIEAKGGWYSVDGGKNMRLADLNEMISDLATAKPSAEKKAAKPAAEKKAAKPAAEKKAFKPAPKKKPAAKANKSDFSVKAFWAEKIKAQNPDTKLPR